MNSFAKGDVLVACASYGLQLLVVASLDPVKVAKAIASNESSFGYNCGPRHEPAYEATGALWARKAMTPLLVQYPPVGIPPQSPAACSYGPWQMMFCNFQGCTPQQLLTDLDLCASEFVRFFNLYVIQEKNAQTLEDIAEVWNEGHETTNPDLGVLSYYHHLQAAYNAA